MEYSTPVIRLVGRAHTLVLHDGTLGAKDNAAGTSTSVGEAVLGLDD